MDISLRTLMYSIEVLHAEMKKLEEKIKSHDNGDVEFTNMEDLYMQYSFAFQELKDAYIKQSKGVTNFPPFEDLIV